MRAMTAGACMIASLALGGCVTQNSGPTLAESRCEFHENANIVNKKAAERLGPAAPMRVATVSIAATVVFFGDSPSARTIRPQGGRAPRIPGAVCRAKNFSMP